MKWIVKKQVLQKRTDQPIPKGERKEKKKAATKSVVVPKDTAKAGLPSNSETNTIRKAEKFVQKPSTRQNSSNT